MATLPDSARHLVGPLALLGLAVTVPAHAQTMGGRPPSIPDLTVQSSLVVVGEVVSVRSEWNAARTEIVTQIELRGDEVLRGSLTGGLVTVQQIGGQVGDVTSTLAGAPSFVKGERVLLFLSARRNGTLGVTGLFQGKFSVERDPATGEEWAVRRVPGLPQPLDRILLTTARELIRRAPGA